MASELPEGFGATEFLRFYHGEWKFMLDNVVVPEADVGGAGNLSWDRRAAYLFWAGEGRKELLNMSRLQTVAKVLEGEREERLANIWAGAVSDRFGSKIKEIEVIKREFITELRIGFPGKGWDSGKVYNLFVVVLSPGRKPNVHEVERLALDKSVASFDNVEALLEALSVVVTNGD